MQKHFTLAATRAAEPCSPGVGTVRQIRTAPTHQGEYSPDTIQDLTPERHAVDMPSTQCCWEARTVRNSHKWRYAANPLGGGNPQLPAHLVEGAGWALSTPRVLAGFSHHDMEMARLPRQRPLTFQLTLRAYPIRRPPLAFLAGSARLRIRPPLLVARPRYSDNVLPECSLSF